ncbi:DoxX family protein [Streptomyces sp. NPDC048419]|uniref:DoxX family protein n=1 Tax=Streptomyces sp. NPDC048419 TaxID=3365547 RepID=UPI0037121539
MFAAYVVVTVAAVVAVAWTAVADFMRVEFVLGNMAEVGVPQRQLPLLAALKAAGAVGLLLGLLGVHAIGVAAAIGLVLFFVAAVALHLRTHVVHNLAWPGGYLVLSAAALVVDLLR